MKKTFLILSTLLFANIALADIPEIVAKNVTCQELKDQLANYKEIIVVKKKLLGSKRTRVSSEIECRAGTVKLAGVFKTSDVDTCVVGVRCKSVAPVVIHSGPVRPHHHGRVIIHRHGPIHRPVIIRPIPHRPIPHTRPAPHAPRGPRYNPPRPSRCHGRVCNL